MSKWYMNKAILITGVAVAAVMSMAISYRTSDYHAYKVAIEHYREKEYQHAVAILDRLSPKYKSSSKGIYLHGICRYNLALESYGLKRYEDSLKHLNMISEIFSNRDDVEDLRRKIEEKKQKIAKAKQQRKQLAEAKEQEKIRKKKEEARRKAKQIERKKAEAETLRTQVLAKEKKRLKTLYESELLSKFDIDMNEAWVSPSIWAALDYDTKVGIAATLAKICDLSDSTGRIVVLNNKTGKKLAKYSQTWGFKHY